MSYTLIPLVYAALTTSLAMAQTVPCQIQPPSAPPSRNDITVAVQTTGLQEKILDVEFGNGIAVMSPVTGDAPGQAKISVNVPVGTLPGPRQITLITGSKQVTCATSFTVQKATAPAVNKPESAAAQKNPEIDFAPSGGQQGQTLKLTVTGRLTGFIDGTTKATLPQVAVNSTKVKDREHATVNITIPATAKPGSQQLTMVTGVEKVTAKTLFHIEVASPALISISPNSAPAGRSLQVTVIGQFTQFAKDVTTADFGPEIAVNSAEVIDETHALVNLTIPPAASPGGRDVSMVTNNETVMAHNGFSVQGSAQGGLPDGNVAVNKMNQEYIDLDRTIMTPKSVSDTFGRRIAQRYIVMQISVANRNKDYQWLIQHAGFDVMDFAKFMAQRRDCSQNLQLLVKALNQNGSPFISSADLTMLRGVSEKGQSLDPRNFIIHGMTGAGSVAAGLAAAAKFGSSYAPAVAVFNGPFINALQTIFPDYTVAQQNRLSDSAYSANTIVGKQQAKVIAIFIPQDYFLTKQQQRAYWKDPESVYGCPDLRLLEAEVNGNFIANVTGAPANLVVNIQSADQGLFQQDKFTINGTISGNFLANTTIQLADPVPPGLSIKLDGTPTDSALKFVLTGTKPVTPHTILIFAVKGPAGDPAKVTYEVSYNPAAPQSLKITQPDPCTIKQGETLKSVTLAGKNFLGDVTKVYVSNGKGGLTPGPVTLDSSTQITFDLSAAASAQPGEYKLSVSSLGGPSTETVSCKVAAANAAQPAAGNKTPAKPAHPAARPSNSRR